MCNCSDLKYAKINHPHDYAQPSDIDDAIADLQTSLDALELPVGTIQMWAGDDDPPGGKWIICDGRELGQEDYPDLYDVIGDTYTPPPPVTTFLIPDLRGRFPLGVSGRFDLGDEGGAEKHTLTIDEMPAHNHDTTPGYIIARDTQGGVSNTVSGSNFNIGQITNAGGDNPHNNMPPYLVINFIIKVL